MSKFIIKQAFAEAIDLQQRHQFDDAKRIYAKILKINPNEPNAHHLLSLIYIAEQDFNPAKDHIETAIELAPDQAIFHSNYAGLLYSMGDAQGAIRSYKQSLKIDKKLFQSHYALGIVYSDKQEFEKSIESYNKAIDIKDDSSEAHNNLANLYSLLNNPEAEYHYKRTIELVPQEIFPRLNLSNYFIKISKFKEAKVYLEELIDLDLTSKEVFNSMGVVFKGLEDDINAKKMFMKSLDLDNNFILAKKNLESL
tara:strand:+ start:133 stop:891 length:759 start_codon:yes stop_codon:yes gene_type:complete